MDWNGPDGIPGTEDGELVHPGLDGKLETGDDWVENGHNYLETNLRPYDICLKVKSFVLVYSQRAMN